MKRIMYSENATKRRMKMRSDVYRTTDFGSTVFLLVNDVCLIGARRLAENKVEFAFEGKAQCEGLVSGMTFNDTVSLGRALHEIRKARNVIHTTD